MGQQVLGRSRPALPQAKSPRGRATRGDRRSAQARVRRDRSGVPYRLEFRRAGTGAVNAMALREEPSSCSTASWTSRATATPCWACSVMSWVTSSTSTPPARSSHHSAWARWRACSGATSRRVAASVPVVLGMLRYSRSAEREADEFAITLLRTQGASVRSLVEFFERLSASGIRGSGSRRFRTSCRRIPPPKNGWSVSGARFDDAVGRLDREHLRARTVGVFR